MLNQLAKIFSRLGAAPVELHEARTCPECGSQLAREIVAPVESMPGPPDEWHCPNPDCPPEVLRRLELWAAPEAMDLAGGDALLVPRLVARGLVRDAAEFYRLKIAELASLEGFDLPRARRLWDAIQASKQREGWRVLFGLGIPGIGAAEAQVLCRHFASLEELFAAGEERLSRLDGVTAATARRLTHWHGDPINRKLVRRLARAGVNTRCRPPQ